MKPVILLFFILVITQFSSCAPPLCKIQNCHVAIDHNHVFGAETRANQTTDKMKVYRGVSYFSYIFRKRYKAQESKGYYRKIDNREAYQKRVNKHKK